jgi:1,4-dihydroxy-2-naphthoate octaprenyltransferase
MSTYTAHQFAKKDKNTLLNIIVLGRFHFVFGGLLLYLLGYLIAVPSGGRVSLEYFFFGYLALFLAHLSVSYSNDFFDAQGDRHSKPTMFSGGSGVLVAHPELRDTARRIAIALIALSFITAIAFIEVYKFSPLLLLYILIGNLCGWYYSAPPLRFSHKLYGNMVFALVVCILVPGYGNYIASGTITPEMWIFAFPMLFYGYAFTISVQIPDIRADRINGKKNYASTFGEDVSYKTIFSLSFLASACFYAIPYVFPSQLDYIKIFLYSLLPLTASFYGLSAKRQKTANRIMPVTSSIFLFAMLCDIYLIMRFIDL